MGAEPGISLILPVPEGCHSVSLALQNLPGTSIGVPDYDLFCLPKDLPLGASTATIGTWMSGGDSLSMFGCFPETTFIHCVLEVWHPGNMSVIFSTASPFLRTPLAEIPDATLSYYMGMASYAAVREGSAICGDWNLFCSSWLLSPSLDPLTFWPPPSHPFFPLDRYSPLPTELIPREILGNTSFVFCLFVFSFSLLTFYLLSFIIVIIVDATIRAGVPSGSRETQLREGVLAFFKFTNAEGLPLYFPASASSSFLPLSLKNFPHISYSDLVPRERTCRGSDFLEHQHFLNNLISTFPDSDLDGPTLLVCFGFFFLCLNIV